MKENFDLLFERIIDTLNESDLEEIKRKLENIKGNSIVIGAGGSAVVASFASKVLDIPEIRSSRDLNYMKLDRIDNILVCSYSGKGKVIENTKDTEKNIYVLTNGEQVYDYTSVLKYDNSIKKEKSFISLASTLMPMIILYQYAKAEDKEQIKNTLEDMFKKAQDIQVGDNKVYEIIGGYDTESAMKYLESTMIESGIAIPIVHDKYDFCHGRTTTSYKNSNEHGLIYFDSGKELDKILLEKLKDYYNEIIVIEKYNEDDKSIDNDLFATIKSMYLTKQLAENKDMDLSEVDHSPLTKVLYKFNGEM